MPIITTTAGRVNSGRDIQINLVGGAGGDAVTPQTGAGLVTTITNITQFEYKQDTIDILKTKIDSTTILADLPRTWSGSVEFVRADDNIDVLINNIERAWYVAGVYQNGQMDVTITDPGAGNYNMRFLDVSLKLEDGGTYKGDDLVTVRLAWRAAQRIA
jgi:hypothetical protein